MPDAKHPPRTDRLTPGSLTPVVLVVMNLLPIWGVFFADWKVGVILAIYWLENVAIGLLNVFKILLAQGRDNQGARFFLAPFFCIHYGMFTFGHGMFVFSFFQGDGGFGGAGEMGTLDDVFAAIGALWLPFVALVASHVLSFFHNFIGRGEYLVKSPSDMMFAPYARVVVLHVTIIFGGMVTMFLGSPKPVIILLVLFKTFGDTIFHLREHNKVSTQAAAQAGG